MLYGSNTNRLTEKELAILRRTEKAMCGVKMMNSRNTDKLMDVLVLDETMDKMAKTNYGIWTYFKKRR